MIMNEAKSSKVTFCKMTTACKNTTVSPSVKGANASYIVKVLPETPYARTSAGFRS
jgi:hypothetical protein